MAFSNKATEAASGRSRVGRRARRHAHRWLRSRDARADDVSPDGQGHRRRRPARRRGRHASSRGSPACAPAGSTLVSAVVGRRRRRGRRLLRRAGVVRRQGPHVHARGRPGARHPGGRPHARTRTRYQPGGGRHRGPRPHRSRRRARRPGRQQRRPRRRLQPPTPPPPRARSSASAARRRASPPPQSLLDVHQGTFRMGVPVPDVRPVFSVAGDCAPIGMKDNPACPSHARAARRVLSVPGGPCRAVTILALERRGRGARARSGAEREWHNELRSRPSRRTRCSAASSPGATASRRASAKAAWASSTARGTCSSTASSR